ncbi:hypothetical protein CIB93_26015 [Streptomyces sp. WZ.A104]|uniref:hypothetical protein n=1 Tax=Streptomyces sp. WZ.A104 TaxID=2023771 RepID=UPI000BBBF33A|nr:hypothetical protein [Streptomyces sp. WZ.A104]PCG83186.1 hypothetical protein CIB93_26015 [Streptomyces sp. WZ.A104]
MTAVPSRKARTTVRLHPFRAVRYDPARAGQLSAAFSAPYDDMSPAHARAGFVREIRQRMSISFDSTRLVRCSIVWWGVLVSLGRCAAVAEVWCCGSRVRPGS